ncbi:MAG: AI-2E family transporter [Deltaproteobacteria bacterium]|nr:AI-2E family transporter [Deltaproteobacteria bacterium]
MNQERIVQVFFFGFLALMTWELYQVFEPFLMPLAWAILLAFLFHPALIELDRRIYSRSTSALIITIIVALGVVLPAVWLSERLVNEGQTLYGTVSDLSTKGSLDRVGAWLRETSLGARLDDTLARHGFKLEDEIKRVVMQSGKITSDYLLAHGSSAASNLAGFFLHFGIALLTFFYLLRDGESYYEGLRSLTPLHEEDKAAVFDTLRATLSSVMRGLMLTAVLDGVTIGLGYLVCGVPYWAVLALLTAAAGLLPFGGTTLVWIPVVIYLATTSTWVMAIGLAVWSTIALAIIDNFIKPLAMRQGTGLPTLALFFGLAGGIEAYGPIGIFAGPAVIAIFAALLKVYQRTYVVDEVDDIIAVVPQPIVQPSMQRPDPLPRPEITPELKKETQ